MTVAVTNDRSDLAWAYLGTVGLLVFVGFGLAWVALMPGEASLVLGLGGASLIIVSNNVLAARARPRWIASTFLWLLMAGGIGWPLYVVKLARGTPLLIRADRPMAARVLFALAAGAVPLVVLDTIESQALKGVLTLAGGAVLCALGLLIQKGSRLAIHTARWLSIAMMPYVLAVGVYVQSGLRGLGVAGQLLGGIVGAAFFIMLAALSGCLADLARRQTVRPGELSESK